MCVDEKLNGTDWTSLDGGWKDTRSDDGFGLGGERKFSRRPGDSDRGMFQ